LTYCHVHSDQLGRRVVCPDCKSKFVAVAATRRRFNPVVVAAIAFVVIGGAVVWTVAFLRR
jgi:hypothetical protein